MIKITWQKSTVRNFVRRDVDLIRRQAFEIWELNGSLKISQGTGNLSVLAVIGPGEVLGEKFEEAVLLEVGIGRGRPYNPAMRSRKRKNEWFHKRRKWASLTAEQYQLIAPELFNRIQELGDDKTSGWKPSFSLMITKNIFNKKKGFYSVGSGKSWPKGSHFSVSLQDKFLVSDIYYGFFQSNGTKFYLKGLARVMDKAISADLYRHLPEIQEMLRQKIEWRENGDPKSRLPKVRSLPPYMLSELLEYIPKKSRNKTLSILVGVIQEITGLKGESVEKKISKQTLPNPRSRLGSLELRITSDLDCLKKASGYIVLEVIPKQSELIFEEPSGGILEEVPF